jgi:glycosyltransferase involved in cell wall biosynthesis
VTRGERLRVLFVTHSFPQFPADPIGSFILRLAVNLRDLGVDATVLAPSGPELAGADQFEGIPVHRFRYAPRDRETLAYTGTMRQQVAGSFAGKLSMASYLAAGARAARRLRIETRADVLHAHWWFPAGLIATSKLVAGGAPTVTTLHGTDLRIARSSALGARLFRSVARKSAAMTTVSSWLAREAEALAPGTGPIVAPMPIPASLFAPGPTRDRDRLLFIGKLNTQKGFDDMLRALGMLRTPARLDIVVGVGGEVDDARRRAEERGVAHRVTVHPLLGQAELARLYRQATIFVVPAVDEGLGLTAVEAGLSGTPVVAYASGGLPDIVQDGRTGLLVPPKDVTTLAAAIDRLLSLPDQGASLGANGRWHALETFAPDAVARRYEQIYRGAIERAAA